MLIKENPVIQKLEQFGLDTLRRYCSILGQNSCSYLNKFNFNVA